MKVVILCGGLGTRLREETETVPKPMVKIGQRPILWHIMKTYSAYGFNEFVLCLGYKSEVIKDYFYHYRVQYNDFTINLKNRNITLQDSTEEDWTVTLADTGLLTGTGARIKRVEKYIDGDTFMVTYGDGVTDINIKRLLKFHKSHGKIGTVSGVCPPFRYGELKIDGNAVVSFREKPEVGNDIINGGYFVFNRGIFDYLSDDESCMLERAPLEKLSRDDQLKVYHHKGFWQCMDTYRDLVYLNELWAKGNAPWECRK